jgi:hypothetical protein
MTSSPVLSIRPSAALGVPVVASALPAQSFEVEPGSASPTADVSPATRGGPSTHPGPWNVPHAGRTNAIGVTRTP